MFNKNHVGRPSNLEIRNRKIKKILTYTVPILVVVIGIIILSSGSLNKLMGNSVTTYYCEDSTYTLNGTKCTKLIKEKAHLLGDIENNGKINSADATSVSRYINKNKEFDEFQIAAMDANEDGEIDEQDAQIIFNHVSGKNIPENGAMYEVGQKLVCPNGYELDKEYCTKTLTADAKVQKEKSYTIYFEAGNGRGIMDNQEVVKGQNIKVSKNKFSTYNYNKETVFDGWKVENKSDNTYYCYTNASRTQKGYSKQRQCEDYGYVMFEDEAIIPDEILVDDLIFIATWKNKNIDIQIIPDKVETKNIQNCKVSTNNNIFNEKSLPSNSIITYKIKFDISDNSRNWYYKTTKTIDPKRVFNGSFYYNEYIESSDCKKVDKKEIIETLNHNYDNNYNCKNSYSGNNRNNILSVFVYTDNQCKDEYIHSSKMVDAQKFYVKYDLKGGKLATENSTDKVTYYFNSKNEQNILYHSSYSGIVKKFFNFYKEGYDLEGFKVKNSDNQYICYTNSEKTSLGYTNDENCKKYGYVIYYPDDILSRTTSKPDETITFEAQWSKDIRWIEYFTNEYYASDTTFPSPQKVNVNGKIKLTKWNKVIDDFAGWKVKRRESEQYYCYTNSAQTNKDYASVSICDNYGYVLFENGAEIPKEILKNGILLMAAKNREKIIISSIKAVKATTTNIQNGKVTTDTNVENKKVFPSNTRIDFNIKIKFNTATSNTYYLVNYGPKSSTANCKRVPTNGEFSASLNLTAKEYDGYRGGYTPAFSNNFWISFYADSSCKNYIAEKDLGKYSIQTFNVKYDSNGGSKYKFDKVIKAYNYQNPLDIELNKKYSTNIHKDGYELTGFRVKNSKGKYICYNSKKESQGFVDESECKKHGYVIYTVNDKLSRTTSADGETLTFIAQWIKKPVIVSMGKLGQTSLNEGVKIYTPIRFYLNDKENTYYFKWGYYKDGYNNRPNTIKNYSSTKSFINYADPVSGSLTQSAASFYWHLNDSTCRKITDGKYFEPTLTVNRYVNAGVIMVYKDSKCSYEIDTEKDVYKLTEVYFCKNCNI